MILIQSNGIHGSPKQNQPISLSFSYPWPPRAENISWNGNCLCRSFSITSSHLGSPGWRSSSYDRQPKRKRHIRIIWEHDLIWVYLVQHLAGWTSSSPSQATSLHSTVVQGKIISQKYLKFAWILIQKLLAVWEKLPCFGTERRGNPFPATQFHLQQDEEMINNYCV